MLIVIYILLTCAYISYRCGGCCGSKHRSDYNAVEKASARGDSCGWHIRALKDITGLQDADIIYASFTSEVHEPKLCIAFLSVNMYIYS